MEKRRFPPGRGYATGAEIDSDYGYTPTFQLTSVSQVRKNSGYEVRTYRELVSLIAELANRNHRYNLMFRGQPEDYRDSKKQSVVYPSIFRPEEGRRAIRKETIKKRFKKLNNLIIRLKKSSLVKPPEPLRRYKEYYMAIIQHYQIYSTPLIDLTLSLHVAASFALHKTDIGYLLVFGMPYPHGSISYFVDENIVMVKLQSVCPPEALRPHFQEGWLVGRLALTLTKEAGDNLARRLIGKYRLDNSNGQFWDEHFQPIPMDALIPKKDDFYNRLIEIID
jgi:hypothetical protein